VSNMIQTSMLSDPILYSKEDLLHLSLRKVYSFPWRAFHPTPMQERKRQWQRSTQLGASLVTHSVSHFFSLHIQQLGVLIIDLHERGSTEQWTSAIIPAVTYLCHLYLECSIPQ